MNREKRYTKQQIDQANLVQIAPLLQQRGYALKLSGSEWLLQQKGTDSITIRGNKWYSHYQKRGGGAVSFCQYFFGCSKQEALEMLLGANLTMDASGMTMQSAENRDRKKEPKVLALPAASPTSNRVYEYLTRQRLLDPKIVNFFMSRGQIYESAESHGNHYVHNLVLVGKDGNGTPQQAHIKGIMPGSNFRHNAEGSDARYGFAYYGKSDRLFVFEAAIDLMSFLTIYPYNWQDHSYIALDGTAEPALLTALEEHPNLNQVSLCLDHDAGGQMGVFRLQNILLDRGILADVISPKMEKDWNEQLRRMNFQSYTQASDHPLFLCMENEFQNLISRGMILPDKMVSLDQLNYAVRRFEALSREDDPQQMARPLRTAALYAGVLAKEQLRHIGMEMDEIRWKIRLFNEMNWPDNKRQTSAYLKELQYLMNGVSRLGQPKQGWSAEEKKQLASEFIQMAAKCMALSAYYEHKYQQSLESEATPCQTQSC